MEGIQTIQALKAVQSSLPAQTTIPSDELVMLYATDGTPIAKISRDDLVKAVASVMASNSQNTFSKLLGVQANGTPMGIGASDLASVLGVQGSTVSDLNTYLTTGGFYITTEIENGPSGVRNAWYYLYVIAPKSDTAYQILKPDTEANGNWYHRLMINNSWGSWHTISQDIPTFYKDYNSYDSLISALQESLRIQTKTIYGAQDTWIDTGITSSGKLCLVNWLGGSSVDIFACANAITFLVHEIDGGIEYKIESGYLYVKFSDEESWNTSCTITAIGTRVWP